MFQFLKGAIDSTQPKFPILSGLQFQFLKGAIDRNSPADTSAMQPSFNSSKVRLIARL